MFQFSSEQFRVKVGLAEMLKGGVIMDVTNAEQAKIAEDAGASAVMALERVPADIRKEGGVARMANIGKIEEIMRTVTIPVMAKVSRFEKDYCVTGELNVEYVKPVPIGEELTVEGWEVERAGRIRRRQGEIRNSAGALLARGSGKFVEVDPGKFRRAAAEPATGD